MKNIKAVIRPEKVFSVLGELDSNGFHSATRISVLGRGKQRGLKVGDTYYDEIPKEMLMIVVEDEDCEKVLSIITKYSRTSEQGAYGDGKIFVSSVERVITVSSGKEEL